MDSIISRKADVMHGAPCFAGTRVAVASLFDHLETGHTIEEFLAEFPSVRREQVVALLEEVRNDLDRRPVVQKA